MAISVYTGVMGSGKTYEAVRNGIIPAVKSGRRVVTNISGVDSDAVRAYLVARGSEIATLGHVLVVPNEAVSQAGFFPGEATPRLKFEIPDDVSAAHVHFYADSYVQTTGKAFTRTTFQLLLPEFRKLRDANIHIGSCLVEAAVRGTRTFEASSFFDRPRGEVFADLPDNGPSVVKAGDFVVIDEAWRYWSDAEVITAEHNNFFRMHRHYVSEAGVACDLLIIIQDFASLNRFVRGVCELVLVFQKLKTLGFSKSYRVEVYEGKPTKKTLVSTNPYQKYDKTIFPLYQSYDGKNGTEKVTDDRQNLLKNKGFLASMALALGLMIYGGNWLSSKISHWKNPDSPKKPVPQSASPLLGPQTGQVVSPSDKVTLAPDVRLVAVLEPSYGETIVIFQTPDGRYVRRHMTGGVVDGWQSRAAYDGRIVGFYFGGKAK